MKFYFRDITLAWRPMRRSTVSTMRTLLIGPKASLEERCAPL